MKLDGFTAETLCRTVEVHCPDDTPLPDFDHSWVSTAIDTHPGLTDIEGPIDESTYVFHWHGTETDGQVKFRSLRIIQERCA